MINDRVEEIMFLFPLDPSMNNLEHVLIVVPTFEVGKLKVNIKSLVKENVVL